MFNHINQIRRSIYSNKIFKNSLFGIFSNILQNIFFSVFFIIVARVYSSEDFGNYVICNTIYSFILGFSTLGLGNWFIRELKNYDKRELLVAKFLKIQFLLGCFFYIINIIISCSIYDSPFIRIMSLIFGLNIITDNLIYVVKSIGIADLRQEKTYIFSTLESLFKFLIACLIIFIPVSMKSLVFLLIVLRFSILYLFMNYGIETKISLKNILNSKSDIHELLRIIKSNWSFVVIATIAVVNWRIGNIFVSKYLTISDVGFYEVSFKLLSIAYIIPVVVSTSVYPFLVDIVKENKLMKYYPNLFRIFNFYGFFAFSIIYSFSDYLIPLLFGKQFSIVSIYCKQMFVVMLFFPSVLLQANLMIAVKKEKTDMYCNLFSLCLNILICAIALPLIKSVSVVIFAIVASFALFHVIQDVVLIRSNIISVFHVFSHYFITIICLVFYYFISKVLNGWATFSMFWTLVLIISFLLIKSDRNKNLLRTNLFKILPDKI